MKVTVNLDFLHSNKLLHHGSHFTAVHIHPKYPILFHSFSLYKDENACTWTKLVWDGSTKYHDNGRMISRSRTLSLELIYSSKAQGGSRALTIITQRWRY